MTVSDLLEAEDMQALASGVERLRDVVAQATTKLSAQSAVLARLQDDAAAIGERHRVVRESAAGALQALRSRPAVAPEPLPAPAREFSFYGESAASAFSPRLWLPYATLALAAAAFSFGLPRLYARRSQPFLPPPPPNIEKTVLPIDFSASATTPADGEVSRQDADAVLNLVYDYTPPGSRRRLREILQRQIDDAAQNDAGAPWIIESAGAGRFLATLRPKGDDSSAPVYEFEVDPARGLVQPSQETQADLQSGPRLAVQG